MKDEAPPLLNPELPDLKAVLGKADVVLHVLDARDPASYRLSHVKELTSAEKKTELVYVLNKIGVWSLRYLENVSLSLFSRPRSTRSVDCMGETPT